ncbi:hypothetical protein FACS189430_07210 [Bacteroidia bacterium]|nr:hypothetical protein FACS189430_07210 [Bacteroidia bacterium]
MKYSILFKKQAFFLFILLFGCTATNHDSEADKVIYFDSGKSIKKYDLENILDGSFRIVPLETNDDCLISKIDKIEIRNNSIYILDLLAKSVFSFDMNGKYTGKIYALGHGPGEYANLVSMTVTDTSILIIDNFTLKQIEYSLSTKKVISEEHIFKKIWARDLFTLSGQTYYQSGYSNSNSGKYRLFNREKGQSEFECMLPFDKEPLALGIDGYTYAINGDSALLIFSGCDIIYRLKGSDVYPAFEVKFKDPRVQYYSGKVENVFQENGDGRVFGISSINESDKYIFFEIFCTGQDDYICMYNKMNEELAIFDPLTIYKAFNNEQILIHRVINNQIIQWREASMLLLQGKYYYKEQPITNNEYAQRITEVVNNLTEEDNPVVFIFGLK